MRSGCAAPEGRLARHLHSFSTSASSSVSITDPAGRHCHVLPSAAAARRIRPSGDASSLVTSFDTRVLEEARGSLRAQDYWRARAAAHRSPAPRRRPGEASARGCPSIFSARIAQRASSYVIAIIDTRTRSVTLRRIPPTPASQPARWLGSTCFPGHTDARRELHIVGAHRWASSNGCARCGATAIPAPMRAGRTRPQLAPCAPALWRCSDETCEPSRPACCRRPIRGAWSSGSPAACTYCSRGRASACSIGKRIRALVHLFL